MGEEGGGVGRVLTSTMEGQRSGGSPLAQSLSPLPGQASSPLEADGALKIHKKFNLNRKSENCQVKPLSNWHRSKSYYKHDTERKQPVTEEHTVKCPEQANLETGSRLVVARGWGESVPADGLAEAKARNGSEGGMFQKQAKASEARA